MTSPAIEFDHVSCRVSGGKTLFADLSVKVDQGETPVLLGRSGWGRRTTIKLINRLLDPTARRSRVRPRSAQVQSSG